MNRAAVLSLLLLAGCSDKVSPNSEATAVPTDGLEVQSHEWEVIVPRPVRAKLKFGAFAHEQVLDQTGLDRYDRPCLIRASIKLERPRSEPQGSWASTLSLTQSPADGSPSIVSSTMSIDVAGAKSVNWKINRNAIQKKANQLPATLRLGSITEENGNPRQIELVLEPSVKKR